MKLLLSGGTGFIGTHLIERLVRDNHTVHVIVRPSTNTASLSKKHITEHVFDQNEEALIEVMQQERFDGVIHLASLFLAQHKSEDIEGLIKSNILFSTQLLEAAVKATVPWFINTGTFWQHYQNKKYSPVNLYAATKQAFESIAQYYVETTPLNFVTIKLSDTFGPNDTRPKVFNLWSRIAREGSELDMSPGEQIIDISFIDNVIDGYVQVINLVAADSKRKYSGKSFAIRSNERMSLKELAQTFEKVTNTRLNIHWGKRPYRPREVMVPWETGQPIPGLNPRISLQEGIKKTFHEK